MLKKPPRVRDNNGALQVRLRLGGRDHFINRIGRFDDPVAQARGQAICAEIWRDAQQGDLDLSLNRYRPLVKGRDQDLLDALRSLAEEKRQARVTHAYRVVMRFGLPIRTKAEVDRFLAWMKAEGLAASRWYHRDAANPSAFIHAKKRSTSALVLIGKPNRITTR